ncbi:hypothetical protein J6590_051596, partial [Homalodisca vitripennis]
YSAAWKRREVNERCGEVPNHIEAGSPGVQCTVSNTAQQPAASAYMYVRCYLMCGTVQATNIATYWPHSIRIFIGIIDLFYRCDNRINQRRAWLLLGW